MAKMNPANSVCATLELILMKTFMLGGGLGGVTEVAISWVSDIYTGCTADSPGRERYVVGGRPFTAGTTHFVHDNVQMPGVEMVKLSPRVVIVVGTAHEVVKTTTVIVVIPGVQVRTVVQGVGIVKICL